MNNNGKYRKSGLTLDEYSSGQHCYSCSHCFKANSDGRCECELSSNRKYAYRLNNCKCYIDAILIMCEECDIYFRTLSRHLTVHKITAKEYKEKHGYNRSTPLLCKSTFELYQRRGKENMFLKGHIYKCDNRGNRWTLRDEGKKKNDLEYEKRGGYNYMLSLIKKSNDVIKGSYISHVSKNKDASTVDL